MSNFYFNLTVVVIERRKSKDWEPSRPPPFISPAQQAKIDLAHAKLQNNIAALQKLIK